MIIQLKHKNFSAITDSSLECDSKTAFVKTAQNAQYEQKAIDEHCAAVLSVSEVKELLKIDSNIKIIGITGTNGKTTTAAALYSFLLDLGYKCALQGTRGCFVNDRRVEKKSLTTPPILQTMHNISLAKEQGCSYFVMEVSSHAISQKRVESIDFSLKIFTNISQDHLDFHKTMDNYIAVKSSFFSDDTPKLINKDDEIIRFNKKNCMTYGCEKPATYKVMAYSLKDGIAAVLQKIDTIVDFHSPLQGQFNIYNLTAALGAVDMLGAASINEAVKVVPDFAGVSGRMEVVSEDPLVIVDFAHTPDGIEKILEALKEKNLTVVFGAGGDRDVTKRPLMAKVACRFAKKIILTSDNPRGEDPQKIVDDILVGMRKDIPLIIQIDRRKALEIAVEGLQENDVLVVLGKGDENYQEIAGVKYPFDDREILRTLLAQ